MADEPKAPPPREPLSYATLPRRSSGTGWTFSLKFAVIVACAVLFSCAWAISFMPPLLGWALVFGMLIITTAFIVAGKKGLSAALAILLAAICAFILMVGLCSQLTIHR